MLFFLKYSLPLSKPLSVVFYMKNKKAFEKLYIKYYPTLLVYGKTITPNEQAVEDTIQELFILLWQKRKDLMIKSSLENYLFVSFRNNLIRKIKNKPLTELDFDLPDTLDQPIDFANEKVLKTWLERLPPSQKEVIFLRYYQNKSYLEIADMLGISYQVARNFSYRAIKFLKKNMKRIYGILVAF